MSQIIILTIGPVQSYISQARRTQDLWQGSRILSYLASIGVHYANEYQQKNQALIVYPALEDRQTNNVPNRIVVQWLGDREGARACAAGMKSAIEVAWETLSINTLNYFLESVETGHDKITKIWKDQQKTWLECYWIVSEEDDNKKYWENLKQANDAMGARKLLRNFPPIYEHGRKCSITGEHEALHNDDDVAKFWETYREERQKHGNLALLGEHERLSAISTIKRMAHEERTGNNDLIPPNCFPSTSSIASASFRYDVLRALDGQLPEPKDLEGVAPDTIDILRLALEQKLKDFILILVRLFKQESDLFFNKQESFNVEYFGLIKQQISQNTLAKSFVQRFRSIDGDFLFDDTLIKRTIEEYSQRPTNPSEIKKVQGALTDFIKAAQALGIAKPQPYLVILSMDGDQMGRTLGELSALQEHQRFSKTLAGFARENVARIVEDENLGRVVYAGGDDVLALLPVRDALQVAEKLRKEFEETLDKAQILNCMDKPISVHVSTGLAYVHHTHNLQDAVRSANDTQKKIAKEAYDRNAIGVSLLRRSGEPRSMGHRWNTDVVARVTELADAFASGLSRGLPQDVLQIAYSLGNESVPAAAREAEMGRIVKRRLSENQQHRADKLLGHILALTDAPELSLDKGWQNAQCWLELARFIAQKGKRPMTWIEIRPHDVWLFRDGKPFSAGEDHSAHSMFPPTPLTIQGALRQKISMSLGVSLREYKDRRTSQARKAAEYIGAFGEQKLKTGLFKMTGPFVSLQTEDGLVPLVPTPADLLCYKSPASHSPCVEELFEGDFLISVPDNDISSDLEGYQFPRVVPNYENMAGHWITADIFAEYLKGDVPDNDLFANPKAEYKNAVCAYKDGKRIWSSKLVYSDENRMGVDTNPYTSSYEDGQLYQVQFIRPQPEIGLLVSVSDDIPSDLLEGEMHMGGEQRLSTARTVTPLTMFPLSQPDSTSFKIVFLTPAYFGKGWLPTNEDWSEFFGHSVELISAALYRPQRIGGWNNAANRPRTMHNYVAAGSVYYFKTTETLALPPAITENPEEIDDAAAIGFGQYAIGTW